MAVKIIWNYSDLFQKHNTPAADNAADNAADILIMIQCLQDLFK